MEPWKCSAFLTMCHQETKEEKAAFVAKQSREATYHEGQKVQEVTCFCGTCAPLRWMYRCLYCGEFYCQRCAEVHFGKTRAEYQADKLLNEGSDDK